MDAQTSVDWIAVLALACGIAVIVPSVIAVAWNLLAVAALLF